MAEFSVKPFRIHISDNILSDLQERLKRTRWPDEVTGEGWTYGTDLSYLKTLVDYWRDHFDWRKQELELNRFRQHMASLEGIDLHFIHEPGHGPNPMPLLISHGWPGSVLEFQKLIPMLTDPARFGADPGDSFTVVAPSLPGYTFSFKPNQQRFSVEQIAKVFAQLMTDVLRYERFGAQGGDWGAFVTSRLACDVPERLYGIHLNLLAVPRDTAAYENPTDEERRYLEELNHWIREEIGYQWIQGTKPQTLSYGLTDSPVGLAAWIVEKFYAWSDCGGDLDGYLGRDTILTNIMLYWATGTIGSSFWPYYARLHGPWPVPNDRRIETPTGYVEFPKEILRPPRSVAERVYNIQRWTVKERGGHFAALEQPEVLAEEIRAFFRQFR
ncbi:MAG: epoxide hydrolase [Deltaproteobacteria bacterium]|nr:epoxide hydrolase [Deltaproteobacteria bacterium]